eukprot:TRINITY_DN10611_c0_g1_i1.p1 TRINITY_DN10611_c0_g1~~TRINITY_DN10611_c0_g1_i1.p1  ORF type:complete len:410 (-),score=121.72 TRINITY_DN10611_c0_g1_i1:35-1237(-)
MEGEIEDAPIDGSLDMDAGGFNENFEISEEQLQLIEALRENVTEYLKDNHTDEFMNRWLIARDNDVDAATEMFVASMKWREENNIDTILDWFPKSEYFPIIENHWASQEAYTKDGMYMYYERYGKIETKKLLVNVPIEETINYHIYIMERHEQKRREIYEEKGYSAGLTSIMDITGVGMSHTYSGGVTFIKRVSTIDKDNYPETVRRVYFTNVGSVFGLVYNAVKPFLDPSTLKKIFFLTSKKVYGELSLIADDDQIPDYLGGSLVVEDKTPLDLEEIQRIKGSTAEGVLDGRSEAASAAAIDIAARDTYEHPLDIEIEGASIEYNFRTKSHSVGFAVFFETEGVKKECIVQYEKCKANEESVVGTVVCDRIGTYIFHWDNTYSSWTGKHLDYMLQVSPP